MSSPVILWFRRDLRLADHPALTAAAKRGAVLPVFIVDPVFAAPAGPTRVAYLAKTLASLSDSLGGGLVIRTGDPLTVLSDLAREVGAREVFLTADFGPQGQARDARVTHGLAAEGVTVTAVGTPYAVTPGTVVTKAGTPSKVFTPFRRYWELEPVPAVLPVPDVRWLNAPSEGLDALVAASSTKRPDIFGDLPDAVAPHLPPAGERAAHERLTWFLDCVDTYKDDRNIPAIDATSKLSPFLRFGALHPRQALAATVGTGAGREHFASEIAWREFYADVLFHHPDSTWKVLQPAMDHLRVDRDASAVARFQTWARGETGYPLVDAGMRQLLDEGWMHNRVRMVCASFLVKHLHLDWRWGAKWFMWRLVDGDLASNQHGWQWTAGTGTDAAPYHRIFNPTLQAERFDPNGDYVRRYVPALADVAAPACLQPGGGEGLLAPSGYVRPMVDAATERDNALARFAEARDIAKGLA